MYTHGRHLSWFITEIYGVFIYPACRTRYNGAHMVIAALHIAPIINMGVCIVTIGAEGRTARIPAVTVERATATSTSNSTKCNVISYNMALWITQ